MTATQNRYYSSSAIPTQLTSSLAATGNPQVAGITGLPTSYPFTALIDWGNGSAEAISVTSAPTGTGPYTLPCTRGIDGTTATTHSSGALVVYGATAQDFAEPAKHVFGNSRGLSGSAASQTHTSWFNVMDPTYGATGNGSTDDTTAVQAALTAAAASGGTVYFPAGQYKLSSALTITGLGTGVRLIGESNASRLMTSSSTADILFVNGSSSIVGLTIEDLYFGSTAGSPTAGAAIHLKNVSDVRIENVSSFSTYNGFYFEGTTSGRTFSADRCYVSANNWAVYSQCAFNSSESQYWGGSVGILLDSAPNCRLFGVGIGGPMCVLTRNTQSANVGQIEFFDVETNNVGGTAPTEGWGGFMLDWSQGPIGLTNCFCNNGGVSFGGHVAPSAVNIVGGTYQASGPAGSNNVPVGGTTMNNAINMQGTALGIAVIGAILNGTSDSTRDAIAVASGVSRVAIIGNTFLGTCRYNINSAQTDNSGNISFNSFGGYASVPLNITGSFSHRISENNHYNPVGFISSPPAVAGSGTAVTNTTNVDAMVYVTVSASGGATSVSIGGTATGITSSTASAVIGPFRVPVGQTITITYTNAPTWKWFGD